MVAFVFHAVTNVKKIIFAAISHDVAEALLRWVYTDIVNIKADDKFILDLLRASTTFQLTPLSNRYVIFVEIDVQYFISIMLLSEVKLFSRLLGQCIVFINYKTVFCYAEQYQAL